jgi:hypothetical protein
MTSKMPANVRFGTEARSSSGMATGGPLIHDLADLASVLLAAVEAETDHSAILSVDEGMSPS